MICYDIKLIDYYYYLFFIINYKGYSLNDCILVELQMEVIERHRPSHQFIGAYYSKMRKDLDALRFSVLHWATYLVIVSVCYYHHFLF